MRRRDFITLLGSAAASPLAARGETASVRIGFLGSGAAGSPITTSQIADIKQGLKDNGLIESRDYVLESRFSAGNYQRFPAMARELAQARVRVLLVNTIASARAAQHLDPPVPVVMLSMNDPVGVGLIKSLAHPGGYITGLATLNEDLTSKQLEYQRAIVPKASLVAALYNPANPSNPIFVDDLRTRSSAMGITVLPVELKLPDGPDGAFATLAAQRPDALQIISDSGITDFSDRIAAFAIAHRLPSFGTSPQFAEFGGLLAYGASRRKMAVRSGYYVKRILEGANPGDLPVEQPTQIELWINLKTARALALEIPLSIKELADEVIE